jgi:hypothetical protein
MNRSIHAALCAAVVLLACGCKSSHARYMTWLFFGDAKQTVEAECLALRDAKVAVVIYGDPRLFYDYPNAELELGYAIRQQLTEHVEGVDVVPPERVESFKSADLNWDRLPRTQLARKLGADKILMITLHEFTTRYPGHTELYQARIGGSLAVYDASRDEADARVDRFEDPVHIVFPEDKPLLIPSHRDQGLRVQAEAAFARKVGRKFYKHQVEVEQ